MCFLPMLALALLKYCGAETAQSPLSALLQVSGSLQISSSIHPLTVLRRRFHRQLMSMHQRTCRFVLSITDCSVHAMHTWQITLWHKAANISALQHCG